MTGWAGGWDCVVDLLTHHRVPAIFGLPADDLQLLDALQNSDIRVVLCRDQRNAMFQTVGYALQSGSPGVCVLGKGPAVTNAMTGLLEARSSGAPVVVLAAGTPRDMVGARAFQELDQLALVRPLTKWATRVEDAKRLPATLDAAWRIATSGAPGPVYVELPDHLLTCDIPRTRPWSAPSTVGFPTDRRTAAPAFDALLASRRPIMLVGGGMRHRNADRTVESLAERLGAAIFATASGRGTVDEDHPQFCGLAGLYSGPEFGELWRETDLVLALGSRLEETAVYEPGFAAASTCIVQVNVDPAEFSAEFAGPLVLADAGRLTADWATDLSAAQYRRDDAWTRVVHDARAAAVDRAQAELGDEGPLRVVDVLALLDDLAPEDRILVQENGLADMWSYFYPRWSCHTAGGSVVPSEQTSLGFGAAAAGGVAVAAPGRLVVALVGDGAFAMVRNDLATLVAEGATVLYLVLRNGGYGWLQNQLEHRGGESRFCFVGGSSGPLDGLPDGVHAGRVTTRAQLPDVLADALKACADGRVAVVEMPVPLDDAALADSHGDGLGDP